MNYAGQAGKRNVKDGKQLIKRINMGGVIPVILPRRVLAMPQTCFRLSPDKTADSTWAKICRFLPVSW